VGVVHGESSDTSQQLAPLSQTTMHKTKRQRNPKIDANMKGRDAVNYRANALRRQSLGST